MADALRARASEVFGRHNRPLQLAKIDAFRLWLAWRGDSSYLIANLSGLPSREGSWQVVKYTEIPRLSEAHNYLEARCLGKEFPEHVQAHFIRFVLQEISRMPPAKVELEGSLEESGQDLPYRAVAEEAFSLVKGGRVLTARWPSKGAPGLFSRVIVLSNGSIQDSKYPALDRTPGPRRASNRGLTKFLERTEKKHQERWVRWVTHG